MKETSDKYKFEAAVQRPLSIVFRHPNGAWEGHDYLIEVVTERQGLDSFDVVMDFRELESHLDALLDPFRGKLLSDSGINDPIELAQHLARFGKASVSLPGGCAIGARPIDLHLEVMSKMGASIDIHHGYVEAALPSGKRLKGIDHTFPYVSVGATENSLLAAALADGKTILRNAAQEPEVSDLASLLVAMGIPVEGIGTSTLTLEGQLRAHGAHYTIIPDRIEVGTFICALAITGGSLSLLGVILEHVETLLVALERSGCKYRYDVAKKILHLERSPSDRLQPIHISTAPYPDFPTDLQAQCMAVLTQAEGTSTIIENIFENRFQHVMELQRLGASIDIDGRTARVHGPSRLSGTTVMASDLRASAGLVIAGLVAEGSTTIERIYHLDRGYAHLDHKLRSVGVDIQRIRT